MSRVVTGLGQASNLVMLIYNQLSPRARNALVGVLGAAGAVGLAEMLTSGAALTYREAQEFRVAPKVADGQAANAALQQANSAAANMKTLEALKDAGLSLDDYSVLARNNDPEGKLKVFTQAQLKEISALAAQAPQITANQAQSVRAINESNASLINVPATLTLLKSRDPRLTAKSLYDKLNQGFTLQPEDFVDADGTQIMGADGKPIKFSTPVMKAFREELTGIIQGDTAAEQNKITATDAKFAWLRNLGQVGGSIAQAVSNVFSTLMSVGIMGGLAYLGLKLFQNSEWAKRNPVVGDLIGKMESVGGAAASVIRGVDVNKTIDGAKKGYEELKNDLKEENKKGASLQGEENLNDPNNRIPDGSGRLRKVDANPGESGGNQFAAATPGTSNVIAFNATPSANLAEARSPAPTSRDRRAGTDPYADLDTSRPVGALAGMVTYQDPAQYAGNENDAPAPKGRKVEVGGMFPTPTVTG